MRLPVDLQPLLGVKYLKKTLKLKDIDDKKRNYKKALSRLPANRKKLVKYRDKTIKEILAMPEAEVEPMHSKTANENLRLVSRLMGWAIKQGYLEKNYAQGLSFPVTTRPSEEKSPYSMNDIAKIIGLVNGFDRQTRPERYWIPLIAMFSATRMAEICQLHKEDIKEINGVWSFDISYKHGLKKIKTKAGQRVVPIHKHLVSLGLLDFVNSAKTGHLWTNLKYDDKHAYTHQFQKWFGELNRKEITIDQKKDLPFAET
jgi:integrase